jgi:tetratricopeptide (TPR) repeat protein
VRAADTMVNELAAGLERMVGPTESRLALLRQAAVVFDEAAGGRSSSPELRRQWVHASAVLCKAYRSLGELQSALKRTRDAEAGARALLRAKGSGPRERALLASALTERSDAEAALGKTEEARAARDEALSLLEPMVASGGAGPDERRALVILLQRRADRLYDEGRLEEARAIYERGHAIAKGLTDADPGSLAFAAVFATTVERLGDMHYYADKDTKAACGRYREALRARRALAELAPNDPALLQGLSIAMQNVGWCAEDAGEWKEALPLYEESVALQKRLLGADPHNTIAVPNLMGGLGTIANALVKRGDFEGAVGRYREAVEVGEAARRERRATAAVDAKTANIRLLLADALVRRRRTAEAAREVDASEAILRDLQRSDPENATYRELLSAAASTRKEIAARHP